MLRRIESITKHFSAHPKQLFLVDGLGAILSATLAAIIAGFERVFGMPAALLNLLEVAALLFAFYSLTCSLFIRNRWRAFLLVIVVANVLYCVATITSVVYFYSQLTLPGMLFFFSEVTIVICLACLELHVALKR